MMIHTSKVIKRCFSLKPITRQGSFSYPGESFRAAKNNAKESRILVTGSSGQIGQELIPYLREKYGQHNVVASDVRPPNPKARGTERVSHDFIYCDVADADNLARIVLEQGIDCIIHNASLLSAVGEQNPQLAIKVNSRGIENVLEVARQNGCSVFAPSTIAVFGPSTPQDSTPDDTVMRPTTVYGVTKVYLELLGEYYNLKYGVDFRSMRYPGIISNKTLPGGGTTDYAVEIFYEAVKHKRYTSFLSEDSMLPMMYMPDCLKATGMLLEADSAKLRRRTYNITSMSFTPRQLVESIRKIMPEFQIEYKPDFRQKIANSWPKSLDDIHAREDWDWEPDFDLDKMCEDMMKEIEKKLSNNSKK